MTCHSPFSSFPKTSTALVSSLGDLDTFRPIGRVIPRAKCGDKTVRGIELMYMFYINRIVLVNFLKETIQEFEANCTNHFKIACAHPIRTGHGDRSCTLHAVYECLPKRLDDHACFCFKWPLTYFWFLFKLKLQRVSRSTHGCDDTHKSRCVTVSCGMDMHDKRHGLQAQIAQENKAVAVLPFSLHGSGAEHRLSLSWLLRASGLGLDYNTGCTSSLGNWFSGLNLLDWFSGKHLWFFSAKGSPVEFPLW